MPEPTLDEIAAWHHARAAYHSICIDIGRDEGDPVRVEAELHCRAWHSAADRRIEALARLRNAADLHVKAWTAYFRETGGEPSSLWDSFAGLKDALATRPAEEPCERAGEEG